METRPECLTRQSNECPSGMLQSEIWELVVLQYAEIERLRAELDGMTKARNRFCGNINQIGRLLWGNNKDQHAPDAIIRNVGYLLGFIRDRVHCIKIRTQAGYHGRRLYFEAEKLLTAEAAVESEVGDG